MDAIASIPLNEIADADIRRHFHQVSPQERQLGGERLGRRSRIFRAEAV